jgi:hypothetical protein
MKRDTLSNGKIIVRSSQAKLRTSRWTRNLFEISIKAITSTIDGDKQSSKYYILENQSLTMLIKNWQNV